MSSNIMCEHCEVRQAGTTLDFEGDALNLCLVCEEECFGDIEDITECTCDLMAHPCEVHDTDYPEFKQ